MKKLRKNSGFTLVECVVAMAVLAVMTLGLLMILNVTVQQRNKNTNLERNVDSQVEDVVNGNLSDSKSIAGGDIDFGNGIVISGAQMNYNEDNELPIGALSYDVGYTPSDPGDPADPADPAEPDEDVQPSNLYKVYGATTTYGNTVTINEQGGPVDNGDGTYTVTWRASFNVTGDISTERSLKIVYPSTRIVSYKVMAGSCNNIHKLGSNTVRIEPGSTGYMQVDVQFIIPEDKYTTTLIQDHFSTTNPTMNTK